MRDATPGRQSSTQKNPVLVLLPGMDGTGRLFRWFVQEIEPRARCVVVTYPDNRFLNYTELVDRVAGQLPTEPFALVGESFSGPIAALLGARGLPNLGGIVLAASFVASPVPRVFRFAPLETLFRLRVPRWAIRRLLVDGTCRPEIVQEISNAIRSVSPAVLAQRLRAIVEVDATDGLKRCSAPVACLSASRDRLIGFRGTNTIGRVRPDAASVTLDGPHLLLQARPQTAARALGEIVLPWFADCER